MSKTKSPIGAVIARYLKSTETIVLALIAFVLVALAILLLWSSFVALINAVTSGHIRELSIEILDSVLLVMMTMEIVYTVTLSIESHKLEAEPFLVVGTIAVIRRVLVITAESTKLALSDPIAFRTTLIELGLLTGTIVVLAIAIYLIRRSKVDIPPGS